MQVKIKKIYNDAVIPTQGSKKSAGYDLYAYTKQPIKILPHKTVKIETGISMTPPEGYFGAIVARSGLATKKGLAPSNKIGICDEDYTGQYIVALHNHTDETQIVDPFERIAQLVFFPYINVNFTEVDRLEETERGAGGFGSTGTI